MHANSFFKRVSFNLPVAPSPFWNSARSSGSASNILSSAKHAAAATNGSSTALDFFLFAPPFLLFRPSNDSSKQSTTQLNALSSFARSTAFSLCASTMKATTAHAHLRISAFAACSSDFKHCSTSLCASASASFPCPAVLQHSADSAPIENTMSSALFGARFAQTSTVSTALDASNAASPSAVLAKCHSAAQPHTCASG